MCEQLLKQKLYQTDYGADNARIRQASDCCAQGDRSWVWQAVAEEAVSSHAGILFQPGEDAEQVHCRVGARALIEATGKATSCKEGSEYDRTRTWFYELSRTGKGVRGSGWGNIRRRPRRPVGDAYASDVRRQRLCVVGSRGRQEKGRGTGGIYTSLTLVAMRA